MTTREVILLDEAVEELEFGRLFYEARKKDVGSYFVSSLLSDITSLQLHSGIHSIHFGYHRLLSHPRNEAR